MHPVLITIKGQHVRAASQNDFSMCGATQGTRVHGRVVRGRVERIGRPEGTIHADDINWCQDCVAAAVEQQLAVPDDDEP